jgi:GT2 family glycosyltransferase
MNKAAAMRQESRFGAVIVNYNCGALAIDAALSFLGDGGAVAVIVDNASPDGSGDEIDRVIKGEAAHDPSCPPDPIDGAAPAFASIADLAPGALRLIRSPRNGGFAFGSNIGLRTLAALPGVDRFLLLNPDAILARGALSAFASRLSDDRAGLCGATIVGFDGQHPVQAFGGAKVDPVLLIGRNIGEGSFVADAPDRKHLEAQLSYPLGAAIALRRDYLARAGYLDERYFLYYEEADWALAGGPANRPAWAPGAIVYHRYGAASKSRKAAAGETSDRSPLSDYHMTRSRILFAMKWRPLLAPVAILAGGAQAAGRLVSGRRENAAAVLRGALPGSARDFRSALLAPAE